MKVLIINLSSTHYSVVEFPLKKRLISFVVAILFSGLDSISMDMKDKKLTVTGDIDPVNLVSKLRKLCRTEIVSVGPAKEEKKKEEPKKEEPKKDEKKKDPKDDVLEFCKNYNYNPPMSTYYYVRSAEEDPNSCVIC